MSFAIHAANDRLDQALLTLMVGIALTVATLLITDINLFGRDGAGHTDKVAVARLAEAGQGVRRRPHDLPVWDTARLLEPLYLKDFVFTDKGASAKLAFLDHSTIELGENTLVEVQQVEENSVLNVIKGSLRARIGPGDSELLIRVNGQKDLIRSTAGAALELRVQPGKPAELKVINGKAEIGKGRVTVAANHAAAITDDAAPPIVTAIAVALLSPSYGAILNDPVSSGVELSWQGNAPPFHVEVARDQSFLELVRQGDTDATEFSAGNLAAGSYYWRVRPAGTNAEFSEQRKFSVTLSRSPELYLPVADQTVFERSPLLRWEGLKGVESYDIQVGSDAQFRTLAWHGASTSPQLHSGALAEGDYYWRVKDAKSQLWSHPGRFTVTTEKMLPVPEPPAKVRLNAPVLPKRLEIQLPYNEPQQSPWNWLKGLVESTAYAKDGEPSPLHWEVVDGAHGYLVEIGGDANFQTKLISERVADPAWPMHDLAPGEYYLRVAGIDEEGAVGPFSAPSQIIISKATSQPPADEPAQVDVKPPLPAPRLVAPVNGEKVHLAALLPVVSFAWRAVPGAATYNFQIATDDDFKSLTFEKQTRGGDLGVELKPHVYYWRMRALRSSTEPGPWGKPNRFEVIHTIPAGLAREPVNPDPDPAPPPPLKPISKIIPKLKPEHGRFSLALAPSRYHYESDKDPNININAKLFNSMAVNGFVSLRPGLAVEGAFRRTATVLFKDEASDTSEHQNPVKIEPFTAQAALRWRLGDDLTATSPFLDGALGYQLRTVTIFERRNDQTISGKARSKHGPTATLAGGIRFSDTLGTRLGIQGFPHGYRAFAVVNQDFTSPGFGLELGFEYAKDDAEVKILVETLLLGFSYSY